jgi:hypothetical protein
MNNLSDSLLPDDRLLTMEEHTFILDRLAALHAAFWEDDSLHDPALLCAALTPYPKTLVHNDFRRPNLGIESGNQTQLYLFDWARPAASVPAIDLIYYLYFSSTEHLPISHEQSIATYKQRLAPFSSQTRQTKPIKKILPGRFRRRWYLSPKMNWMKSSVY